MIELWAALARPVLALLAVHIRCLKFGFKDKNND